MFILVGNLTVGYLFVFGLFVLGGGGCVYVYLAYQTGVCLFVFVICLRMFFFYLVY